MKTYIAECYLNIFVNPGHSEYDVSLKTAFNDTEIIDHKHKKLMLKLEKICTIFKKS